MSAAVLQMPADRPDRPLVRKLRFIEYLTARRDLSPLELRVGIRLVSLTHSRRGFAWPTLDQLAEELAAHKRNIRRAVARLDELGLFLIVRSPGRGHASEYEPNFAVLPSGCAFAEVRLEKRAPAPPFNRQMDPDTGAEKGALASQKGAFSSRKGGAVTPPSASLSDSFYNRSSTEALSAERAPCEQGQPSRSSSTSERPDRPSPRPSKKSQAEVDQEHVDNLTALLSEPFEIADLYRTERSIKAGFLARFSQSDRLRVVDQLEAIAEAHDAHNGGSIGGFARRLQWDAEAFLDHDEDGVPVWPDGYS